MGTNLSDIIKAAEEAVNAHEAKKPQPKATMINLSPISMDPTSKQTCVGLSPISSDPEEARRALAAAQMASSDITNADTVPPPALNEIPASDVELILHGDHTSTPAQALDVIELGDSSLEFNDAVVDFMKDDEVSEEIELDMDNFELVDSFDQPPTEEITPYQPTEREIELEERITILTKNLEEMTTAKACVESRVLQLQEKLVRSTADFDNYRKRVARDKEQFQFQTERRIITDFLGVMDNFERAISHAKQASDFENLLHGVELIAKQYYSALTKHGCTQFDSLGQQFDPAFHDVLSKVEDNSVRNNTIVQEHLKGYMHQGVLLRPAMVVVAQNDQDDESTELHSFDEIEEKLKLAEEQLSKEKNVESIRISDNTASSEEDED